ncbi:MAG: nitroreductase family protein [Candidatus Moduliflexus flocculans]|nr:nitroreductase family protein [Candidatus Moduliflexus flocculans]
MDVHTAIETRRATRSLAPTAITADSVRDLASCARLAPSCSNNQPWRFVFVFDPAALEGLEARLQPREHLVPGRLSGRGRVQPQGGRLRHQGAGVPPVRHGHGRGLPHPQGHGARPRRPSHRGVQPGRRCGGLGIPEEFQVVTLINIGERAAASNPTLTPEKLRPKPGARSGCPSSSSPS